MIRIRGGKINNMRETLAGKLEVDKFLMVVAKAAEEALVENKKMEQLLMEAEKAKKQALVMLMEA